MQALEFQAPPEASQADDVRSPAGIASLIRGGTNWDLRADFAEILLDGAGLRLRQWQREQRLQVIKSGPHRTVYRLDLPAGRFYVKHYKVPDVRAFLQNLVRPCKALMEWRAAASVRESGIPTFEPIAVGRTVRGGIAFDNFLISRAIEDAQSLETFLTHEFQDLPRFRQTRVRQHLTRACGALAARLHAAGLVHDDFHAGNILLRMLPNDQVRIWVIDLHTVRRARPPRFAAVQRNLAVLNQFFVGRATRSDRLRFWKSYAETRAGLGSCELGDVDDKARAAESIREMEQACQQAAVRMWRRADRHWARGNRHLVKLDTPHVRCRGVATLNQDLLKEIREAPDALFDERVEFWCKTTGANRVAAITLPIRGERRLCFWKRSEMRAVWPYFVRLVRGARVRCAWETGHALLRRGIATPKPLAFVERIQGITLSQYLLTEGIPDSCTIGTFFEQHFPRLAAPAQRLWIRAFVRALADQIRKLHAFGFDHRDLKASNILVAAHSEDPRLWLLDLDSVHRWAWLPPQRLVQNLARLNVSSQLRPAIRNTDRLRFLTSYLGSRRPADWKPLWKKIARRSVRKIQQNLRNGRPVT